MDVKEILFKDGKVETLTLKLSRVEMEVLLNFLKTKSLLPKDRIRMTELNLAEEILKDLELVGVDTSESDKKEKEILSEIIEKIEKLDGFTLEKVF